MKKEKGITLIALIITIIVMIVLVAVTISVALNGGLFTKANEAAMKTEMKALEEQILTSCAYDDYGLIDVNETKSNIREVLGSREYSITDTGGELPIKVIVKGNHGSNYEFVVNSNGITSKTTDSSMPTQNVEDAVIAWFSNDKDEDPNIPMIIFKTSRMTSGYSEQEAVNAMNDLFQMCYNFYYLIDYIDTYYSLSNYEWITNLQISDDDKAALEDTVAAINAFLDADVNEFLENKAEPGDEPPAKQSIAEYMYTNGLIESNDAPIHFDNFDDVLSFISTKKVAILNTMALASDIGDKLNEEGKNDPNNDPNNDNYDDDDDKDGESAAEFLGAFATMFEDVEFDSIDSLYEAVSNFDASAMGDESVNDIKQKGLVFLGKEKLKKSLYIALTAGPNIIKSFGPNFAMFSQVDNSITQYTNNLFTNYDGPNREEIMQDLFEKGIDFNSEFIGKKVKIGNYEITITDEIIEDIDEGTIAGLVGFIVVLDPNIQLNLQDSDSLTITFDDFSDTRTKAEWTIKN